MSENPFQWQIFINFWRMNNQPRSFQRLSCHFFFWKFGAWNHELWYPQFSMKTAETTVLTFSFWGWNSPPPKKKQQTTQKNMETPTLAWDGRFWDFGLFQSSNFGDCPKPTLFLRCPISYQLRVFGDNWYYIHTYIYMYMYVYMYIYIYVICISSRFPFLKPDFVQVLCVWGRAQLHWGARARIPKRGTEFEPRVDEGW